MLQNPARITRGAAFSVRERAKTADRDAGVISK